MSPRTCLTTSSASSSRIPAGLLTKHVGKRTLQRGQPRLPLLRIHDHVDADFAGANHLDIDASFGKSFEHSQADACMTANSNALHGDDRNLRLILLLSAEFLT